ncbi:MAG: MGMT family protein [Nocardioidaceae bacterium]|nr:MGMT family protein [Nocardioidaceae bacterium]
MDAREREDYVEAVLSLVERVPAGRVTTYGALAACVGTGGPRLVGRVMSTYGGPVPWWRVVHSDGTPPIVHDSVATRRHQAEGTPLRASGKVDLTQAMWWPDDPDPQLADGPGLSVPGGGIVR